MKFTERIKKKMPYNFIASSAAVTSILSSEVKTAEFERFLLNNFDEVVSSWLISETIEIY